MGTLIYALGPAITIEDRVLRHLHAVIVAKLRRDESFVFNWDQEPNAGGDDHPGGGPRRHGSVWLSKGLPLYFSFDTPLEAPLNHAWLEALAEAAASNTGLRLLPEPAPHLPAGR